METVPFVLKRGHYASLKLLRPLAARFDLTPARFDLLLAVHKQRRWPVQKAVAHRLGVTRSTVCKMIRSMQKAGLVTLHVDPDDRRHRRIRLTPYGRRCFGRLFKLYRRGKIAREVFRAVATWSELKAKRQRFLDRLVYRVARYMRGLDDGGRLFDF